MWQGALALAVQEPRVQAASPGPSAQVISGQASGELGNDMDELLCQTRICTSPYGSTLEGALWAVLQYWFGTYLPTMCS